MQVGRYTIEGELGRGGMGVVYRVVDPSGRPLALKVLTQARQDSAERFAREARLQEQLGEDAGFVPLYDLGSSELGPYLVMPLLSGGTLRERLQGGALGLEESVSLIAHLADALGRAHAQGVVHRDLKPDNILFSGEGRALVADLGLAKHFRRDLSGGSQSQALSQGGELRGTLGYMAPEQLKDATSVGPPADVFALGAMLYECLTGEPCFEASSYIELISRVARGGHGALPRDCPRWMQRLLTRALHPDPERRPADGAALAAALRARGGGGGRGRLLGGLLVIALATGGTLAALMSTRDMNTPAPTSTPADGASPSRTPRPLYPAAWSGFSAGEGFELSAAFELGGPVAGLDLSREGRLVAFAQGRFLRLEGRGLVSDPPLELTERPRGANLVGASFAPDPDYALAYGDTLEAFDLSTGKAVASAAGELEPADHAVLEWRGVGALSARGAQLTHFPVLRSAKGGVQIGTLPDPVSAMASGPRSHLVAAGNGAGLIHRQSGLEAGLTCGGPVAAAALTATAIFLATESGALYRFDPAGQPRGDPIVTDLEHPRALAASAHLAVLIDATRVRVLDHSGGEVVAALDLAPLGAGLTSVALAPDESAFAVGTEQGQVLRFALDTAWRPAPPLRPLATWGEARGRHAGVVTCASVAEGRLLSADTAGSLIEWDPASGRELRGFRLPATVFSIAPVGPDQVLVVAANGVSLCDLARARELWRIPCADLPRAATLRADGREVVLAVGGQIESWSLPERTRSLQVAYPDGPTQVALLPDGRLLVGDNAGKVRLLAVGWQKSVWVTPPGQDPVEVLSLGRGEVLAVGHAGQVRVLSLSEGKPGVEFQARGPVNTATRREGKLLIGLQRGGLELWDEASGAREVSLRSPFGPQAMAALSGEGRAFVGGTRGRVGLVDLRPAAESGEEAAFAREVWEQGPGHEGGVRALSFSAEGDRLTAVGSHRLRSWSVATGEPGLYMTAGVVTGASLGNDMALLAAMDDYPQAGSREWGKIGFYGVGKGLRRSGPSRLIGVEPDTHALSWEGQVFAFTRRDKPGRVFLGRGFGGDDLGEVPVASAGALSLSSDGSLLAVEGSRQLEVWRIDATPPERLFELPGRWGRFALLPQRGGQPPRLAVADQIYGEVSLYDGLSGRALSRVYPRLSRQVTILAGSHDQALLLTGLDDGQLNLWSVEEGSHLRRLVLDDPLDAPLCAAFSPRGDRLAVGTQRGRVAIFALE